MSLVIASLNPKWPTTVVDPDVQAYGQVLQAREFEIRAAAALVGTGALIAKQTDVSQITQTPRTGEQLDALTAVTGWTAGTSTALSAAATNPTGYGTNSFQGAITALAASGVSDSLASFAASKDLSVYGGGTLLRIWARITNRTSVQMRYRVEFATSNDWAEWDILPSVINTYEEKTLPKGTPTATHGTVDWSQAKKRHVIVTNTNGAGTLTTTYQVRDARIGLTQTAKTVPDGHLAWESSYDVRVRERDTATAKMATTLAASSVAGATNVKLTAVALAIGDWLTLETAGYVESRQVTVVGTAGSGGTGVTVSEGFTFAHTGADVAKVYYWGGWSDWLTVKFSQPPTVAASSPANAAVVTAPEQALVHTYSSPSGKLQASRTLRVYQRVSGVDQLLDTIATDGVGTSDTLPRFLLDSGNTYAWEKDVYDTDGLFSTTARRTFTTTFTAPAQLANVVATADDANSAIDLAWDASGNANLDHYRVYWRNARGEYVRIDGGPETLGDGKTPLTGTSFTHYGARLGLDEYIVTARSGAVSDVTGESAPALASDTLGAVDSTSGQSAIVVPGDPANTFGIRVYGAPRSWSLTVETFRPPGRGTAVHLFWGRDGRSAQVTIRYRASTDGDLTTKLETLAGDPLRGYPATPFWLKLAAGYQIDPLYGVIIGLSDAIEQHGFDSVSVNVDEVAQ